MCKCGSSIKYSVLNYGYSSSLAVYNATSLRELACHTGSHSVTCHPAEVTFPSLPPAERVLDLATPGE